MKKVISVAILLIILSIFEAYAYALDLVPHETDVIFDDNTQFTADQQQAIIEHFNGLHISEDSNEANNILCTLFGHNYTTEYVSVVNHNVYASAPRCVKNYYEVSACTRCNDSNSTLISTERIYCH